MKSALVLFAQGSEELEAVTIVNILRRAGVKVTFAGLNPGALRGAKEVLITPDIALSEVLNEPFDMIVLPGGQPGTNHLLADQRILQLLRQMNEQGRYIAAICAAPSILAAAGLIEGKLATCYPGSLDSFPNIYLQTTAIVEDGRLITSRGPGTAMDFALLLAERLAGKAKRCEVEAGLAR